MNRYLKSTIIFIFILFYSTLLFASTVFIDSSDPPPGFESPYIQQHLRVSLIFMNQQIGFCYILLNSGKLKFASPQHLILQLPNVKNNAKTIHALQQVFSLNIECNKNSIAKLPSYCRKLYKHNIYIIYNPQQEMVHLYLSPIFFKKAKHEDALEFLPDSTSGWSYMNKLGASSSFSNDNPKFSPRIYQARPNYYNIHSNNTLAHGNSSFIANLSQNNGVNNGEHFQIQNLYSQHIVRDKIYTGGYITNNPSPFFQTQTIVGLSFKTTLETLKNPEKIMASPLVIFVPQASQVSIFKNDQLIFTEYLEAGYQRINTSAFPEGGYEIAVKIGSKTILRNFFTKVFYLPPEDAPQYYGLGGYLTNGMTLLNNTYNFLPHVLNVPLIQTGVNKRISQRTALLGDLLLNSHEGLADIGAIYVWGNSLIKTAGLFSAKNNYGMYTMFNTQNNFVNLNVILTKIYYKNRKPDYYFLNNLTDNDSASISYKISDSKLLGLQANYNKSLDQDNTYTVGAFYQEEIGHYKGMRFFFNLEYNKTIYVGDSFNLSLDVNFGQDRFAGSESLLLQNQWDNYSNNQIAKPVVLQGSTTYSHQNEQGVGCAVNEIHSISPALSSLAGTYDYTTTQDFVSGYVNYNKVKHANQSVGYGGNIETELAMTQGSAQFNGIMRGNSSGIIAEVATTNVTDDKSKFILLDENNRKVAIITARHKVFISLPKFTDQNYTLSNVSNSDYYIRDPVRHITLYPGNVGYYSWIVEKRVIVMGRVVTKNPALPLANAWIHAGTNGIFSDSGGYFQLELSANTSTLTAENLCKIKLPKLNADKAYLYIGDVTCY